MLSKNVEAKLQMEIHAKRTKVQMSALFFFFDAEFKGCELLVVMVDDTQMLNVRL